MMLEAVELTKHYGSHIVLDHLNLQVEPGEVFCLMGQNGAGKTTTLNLFLGFIAASSGQAWVDGKLVSPGQQASNIAYIPEVVMLYPYLSSLENLDFFSRLAGYRYPKDKLCNYLSQVGLQPEAFEKEWDSRAKVCDKRSGLQLPWLKMRK
ncbi:ATP-binding cassette domain-containing protein [Sphingobacterium sp. E70]|uniref:ATP-binding cassette domain-containing protein n=1 Tax=Sphingobacterium sp. E70 TaxID=2853439 RepID=UPI00211B9C46|nr:ATP-binding cassette domain-containing protein [Sphingobacterium sp. E70]ULT23611.1 ATP-binding cassette domain-containing protein [Sphingobacterium sp. E70]